MDFFSNMSYIFWLEAILRLLLGFILSGVIGLERNSWNKPAGFRTHALVGISAVLIMLCGEYMSNKYDMDPSRIPAQLLSGIGFIGAGTILRDGFNVKGLTTAASLLVVTCIGLSIGSGFYFGGISATIISYLVLSYSYLLTDNLDHFNTMDIEVTIKKNKTQAIKEIENILNDNNISIKKIHTKESDENIIIKIIGKYNNKIKLNTIITAISTLDLVLDIEEV